jgi:hypothetical protein
MGTVFMPAPVAADVPFIEIRVNMQSNTNMDNRLHTIEITTEFVPGYQGFIYPSIPGYYYYEARLESNDISFPNTNRISTTSWFLYVRPTNLPYLYVEHIHKTKSQSNIFYFHFKIGATSVPAYSAGGRIQL